MEGKRVQVQQCDRLSNFESNLLSHISRYLAPSETARLGSTCRALTKERLRMDLTSMAASELGLQMDSIQRNLEKISKRWKLVGFAVGVNGYAASNACLLLVSGMRFCVF